MIKLLQAIWLLFLLLTTPVTPPDAPQATVEPVQAVEPVQVVQEPAQEPVIVQEPSRAFTIRQPFNGSYPFNQGYNGNHNGVDWGLHYYTDVLACDDGVIQSISENSLYGNHIYIRHSWGVSLYAHLDSYVYVNVEDSVTMGQAIAQSGDSGDSFDHNTGARAPHLHFGIQVNGVWVNPMNYI